MGLAKPPCYHDAGGLLHHRFSFSLYALRRRWESSFLRRFPSDHSARPLAGIPPSGARTFLTRAASSTSRAFLGGAAVGAAVGILFAPEKGEDTRHKIAEILRKKGIRLNRSEMENLVDEIAAEIKGEGAE